MKKLLLFLYLALPLISFSQVDSESESKFGKRSERDNPPRLDGNVFINPNPNFPITYPYYNFYNPYNPYIPYYGNFNRFSGSPLQFSMGAKSSIGFEHLTPSLGFYTNFGRNKGFFHMSFEASSSSDYEHYDNITLSEAVLEYDDVRAGEFNRYVGVSLGVGGRINQKISPIIAVNIYELEEDLIFIDDTGILSSEGEYTINGKTTQNFNLMVGSYIQVNSVEFGLHTYFLRDPRVGLTVGFVF